MAYQNITVHDGMDLTQLTVSLPDSCQAKQEIAELVENVQTITAGAVDQVIQSELTSYAQAIAKIREYLVGDVHEIEPDECRARLNCISLVIRSLEHEQQPEATQPEDRARGAT